MGRENEVWADLLGVPELRQIDRVSIIHFFQVDIMVKSNTDGQARFDTIDRSEPTKFQLTDTGNFSRISPARPAASKSEIENSVFYGLSTLLYSDYVLHASTWVKQKSSSTLKRKGQKASSTPFKDAMSPPVFAAFLDSTESMKAGRIPEIPYHESFYGTSMKLMLLIKSLHDHGRSCPGNIVTRRNNVVLKRLSLSVTIHCSRGMECKIWDKGILKWISAGTISLPNSNKSAMVPDVLYAMACYLTPTTKAHADQFLSCMLMTPPSRRLLNDLVKNFVVPYILKEKESLISVRCSELLSLNEGLIINMDVGYTGARKAQCATVMVGSGSRVVFSRTDTENGAWLKEGILVSTALDEAINIRKLDVVAVEIDDNASNKKKIESYKRVNGPPEYVEETVKGLNDVFHAAKSMGRQAIKIVTLFVEQIKSKIKPLIVTLPSDFDLLETILTPLLTGIAANFDSYFIDIKETFVNIGATEWIDANRSISSMQDFAKRIQQVDATIDYKYWTPIVEVYNIMKPPSANSADNISAIIITKSTSMRCLNALANAARKLVSGEDMREENDNNSLEYLRTILPSICFRGDNFSSNFLECLEGNVKKAIIQNEKSTNENNKINENLEKKNKMIKEIFGSKIIPSITEIKKLKAEKIIKLALYLGLDVPTPTVKNSVKEAKEYCAKNLWRLQGLWDDVDAALLIAHRLFSARIGEYKKLLKTLIRVVNETYGMWSIKFKMYFVLSGLINFSKHFQNDHDQCSRFIWWTQCTTAHLNEYLPAQDYVNNVSGGRGVRCNAFVPIFFEILVKAVTLSPYMESLLSKCILYSKTTICESYFHWLGIMVPKWQNVTKSEYILREAAAFIAFSKRQDDKFLYTKKLRQHKYASTLVGTAGQKNPRYERYIFEAISHIASSDSSSMNSANHFFSKIQKGRDQRQERLGLLNEEYETDITAQNLKMGPVKHEFRTAGADGVLSGKQLHESTQSAKPVPPFPFCKENLLTSEVDKQRLNNIWEWSRSISMRKKLTVSAETSCFICGKSLDESDITERCYNCKEPVHESCLHTNNTGWSKDDDNNYCPNCTLFIDVVVLDTSIQ